ncbi:MAG: 50S ribosomal protein L23 [Nanoarchaeota archaeon]
MIRPVTTEKAVKLIETENTILFEVDRRLNKTEIKQEFEKVFNVKVKSVNIVIRKNKKLAYIKIKQGEAIDLATKLGMM